MSLIPYQDKTDLGNEKALKKGFSVPDGAVNLGYINAPSLTPQNNIVMIDASRIIAENRKEGSGSIDIFYADGLGTLQDQNGNQIIQDQFPIISDVFTRDVVSPPAQNFTIYSPDNALPYLHVSRYFHLDVAGLSLGQTLTDAIARPIKIVDGQGNTYTDVNGNPKYRIKITPAVGVNSGNPDWAYRVYAYIGVNTKEDLYLVYDKCEIDSHGNLQNQVISFKELLNPQSAFIYQPEEADVVDPVHRGRKWFSSKPLSLKEQALGLPLAEVDGYKVYVPKKALGDPRVFQLFNWRLKCDITNTIIQQNESTVINGGVVITTANATSAAPYAFYNLQQSNFNKSELSFINPLQSDHSDFARQKSDYWYVNFDTIQNSDLENFDILIWSPTSTPFDFSPYLSLINFFTNTIGKTLIIDTDNRIVPIGLGITTSPGIDPSVPQTPDQNTSILGGGLNAPTLTLNESSPLISSTVGGYTITPDANSTTVNLITFTGVTATDIHGTDSSGAYLTYAQFLYGTNSGFVQYIQNFPSSFSEVVTGTFTFME